MSLDHLIQCLHPIEGEQNELSVQQLIKVNECLLIATGIKCTATVEPQPSLSTSTNADVDKDSSYNALQEKIDDTCEVQKKMLIVQYYFFKSANKIDLMKHLVIPKILSAQEDEFYWIEFFEYYLPKICADDLVQHMVESFSNDSAALLVYLVPLLSSAKSTPLIELCLGRLKEISALSVSTETEVKDFIQLVKKLYDHEGNVDATRQKLEAFYAGLMDTSTVNGDNILLLCLCTIDHYFYSVQTSSFLLKCLNSEKSLVIRRSLFVLGRMINKKKDRYYKNNLLYLNVFYAVEFEKELHLIEQLFHSISKLVKINGDDAYCSESCSLNLVSWDFLHALLSRLVYGSELPTIKKLVLQNFFNGGLGFSQQTIDRIPPKLIRVIILSINSLGGNIRVNIHNKKSESINLLDELESFITCLVESTRSAIILDFIGGLKYAVTISILRGINAVKAGKTEISVSESTLTIMTDAALYHVRNNIPGSYRRRLVDTYTSILVNFFTPAVEGNLAKLVPIFNVISYQPSMQWEYTYLLQSWLEMRKGDVGELMQAYHSNPSCSDWGGVSSWPGAFASMFCFSGFVDEVFSQNLGPFAPYHDLIYAVLQLNPSLGPVNVGILNNLVEATTNDILSISSSTEHDLAFISRFLVEKSDYLFLIKTTFNLKVDGATLVEQFISHSNKLMQILGLYSIFSYAEYDNLSSIAILIISSEGEKSFANDRTALTIFAMSKWGLLKRILPGMLSGRASEETMNVAAYVADLADEELLKIPSVGVFYVIDCVALCSNYLAHVDDLSPLYQNKDVYFAKLSNMLKVFWNQVLYLRSSSTASNFTSYAYKFVDVISNEKLLCYVDLVHDYFSRLVELGSAAIIRKLLANFVPLWLRNTELLEVYADFILKFSYFKEEKVGIDFVNLEVDITDAKFSKAEVDILKKTDYYSLSRAILLIFFDKLPQNNKHTNSFIRWIAMKLLEVCSQRRGNNNLLIGSAAYSEKLRAWQALCILCPLIPFENRIIVEMQLMLAEAMSLNLHNKIRYFMEVFVIKLAKREDATVSSGSSSILTWLIEQLDCPTLSLQHVSSVMIILGHLIISKDISLHVEIRKVLASTAPWLGATQGFTRGISQLLVFELVPRLDLRNDEALANIFHYLSSNQDMQKLRKKQLKFFQVLFVDHDLTSMLQIPVDESNEPAPICAVERIEESLRECYEEKHADTEGLSDVHRMPLWKQVAQLTMADGTDSGAGFEDDNDGDVNFQRKIIPIDSLQLMMAKEMQNLKLNSAGYPKQPLILCASLINKGPNLAGLARTAEIFAATQIVVPDTAIRKRDDFKSMSVGAGDHITMEQCRETDLMGWLKQKKAEGFTIVGIEQTGSSQCMTKVRFPEKVVLLLGKEKEGIPVEFLQMVDICVEIPQLGVIRSLNVHVSGALAIWEYTRQRLFDK